MFLNRRAIQMTVITGISLVIPTASCIYATWDSPDGSDRSLRYWSLFRVLIFLVQIPLRYRIWRMLDYAQEMTRMNINNNNNNNNGMELARINNNNNNNVISLQLFSILETKEWKLTQCFSGLLSAWVGVTLAITFLMETNFPKYNNNNNNNNNNKQFACFHGYLSPCLYRLCWVSIGILCVHVAFVFLWLKNLLNNNNNSNNNEMFENEIEMNDNEIQMTPFLLSQISFVMKHKERDNSKKKGKEKIFIDKKDKCAICYSNYITNDEIRIFNYCKHYYHSKCIIEWLNKCRQKKCPLCNHFVLKNTNEKNFDNRNVFDRHENENENQKENEMKENIKLNETNNDEINEIKEKDFENEEKIEFRSNKKHNNVLNLSIDSKNSFLSNGLSLLRPLTPPARLHSMQNSKNKNRSKNKNKNKIELIGSNDDCLRRRKIMNPNLIGNIRNGRNEIIQIEQEKAHTPKTPQTPQTPNTPLRATWDYVRLSQN